MWWISYSANIYLNSYITKEVRSCSLDTFRFSSKQPEGKINGCVVSRVWWYTITMEIVWNNTLVMRYPSLLTQITVHWAMRTPQMIGYRDVDMCWVPDLVFSIYRCIYLGCVFVKENENNFVNNQSASLWYKPIWLENYVLPLVHFE